MALAITVAIVGFVVWAVQPGEPRIPERPAIRQVHVPVCTHVAPFDPGNYTPPGDWCIQVGAGQTITIRPTARTEILPSTEEARIEVYNQNQDLLRTVIAKAGGCQSLGSDWSVLKITLSQAGMVRARIGQQMPFTSGC